ncbi:formate/nitrite family transporter [Candidatus Latescibacterota bacterium]
MERRQIDFDSYAPAQMAARVEKAGITKGNLDFLSTFALAVMAGVFIAFGAMLYTYVIHDSSLDVGLTKLIGGLVFCLGLILVIVAGAELFTGNNLILMAYVGRKITLEQLLRNWSIVFLGNLIGSIAIVFLFSYSGQWTERASAVGVKALLIANGKVNLTFLQALSRGTLCNILVCLAVWLCFSGRTVSDKILAIVFPITAFVTLGFEHSVANMYFIPAGLILKHNQQVLADVQVILGAVPELSRLTISGFLVHNLIPVTIGNIIGGSLFVGAIYWFVYLRPTAAEPIRRFMTSGPPFVPSGSSVSVAVHAMKEYGTGSVLVGEQNNTLGIISEADVVFKVVEIGDNPNEVKVDQIMSTKLISADIKTPIYQVYRIMGDHKIRHLVITEKGQQVGFVSVKDLLKKSIF